VTATLAPSAANTRAVARPMPLAAPVTTTVNPLTDRLSCLKPDIECSPKMMPCTAGLTRLAPIRREVKHANKEIEGVMNELDFSGKQVLVVGGSSGIGNGIAQAFRANGARVHVCGTRASAADYSPEEGSHLEGLDYAQLDVSDANAIENFEPSFDRLDVLALAQGAVIYRRGEFEMAGFRKVLEVNLISLMACATRFHAMLSAARGTLLIVSSTAAYHSTKGNPAYNASKAGAVGLTRTLGQAWAENGIRVNGIAPGLVATKMTKVTTSNPKRLEGAIERIPLKRLGTPADMAGAALFLASPLASYIVGQTLVVDGGLIL
jgi:3-oxoacyl-[acyl-carrier protein] reductase